MKILLDNFKKLLSNKYNLLLFLLILFHTTFFIVFQTLNKNYQTWDSAGHISISYRMANEIKRVISGEKGSSIVSVLKVSDYYPPLVQLIGAFISLTFGYKSTFLLVETLLFFILSIIFVYKLTLLITKDSKLSFLTTLVYSFFPQIIDQSHYFHLDLPLTALILVSLYFLYLSDYFKKARFTLLFFVFFALVQTIKWYGFVFLLVPVLICLAKEFFSKVSTPSERLIILRNIIISSVVFIFIAAPWYLINWNALTASMKVFSVGESDDPSTLIQKIAYYPRTMIGYQTMFIPSVLLVISIVYELIRNTKKGLIYFLLILIPWSVFIYISNKNLRYILPLTPMFAFLISKLLIRISSKIKVALFLVPMYLIFACFFLCFNHISKESSLFRYISMVFAGPKYGDWYYSGSAFYSYKKDKYPIDKVLDFIHSNANRPVNSGLGVAVLIDSEGMSVATLEMVRLEKNYSNMYFPVPYLQFEPFKSDYEIEDFFLNSNVEYVISPNNPGPPGLRNYVALTQCIDYLNSDRNKLYEKINTFLLPDGNKVDIFKRIGYLEVPIGAEECKTTAGIYDGRETIQLKPNLTYIFYTGHFAIQDKIKRDYEEGVMYLLQIENTIHESVLEIENLPKSGSALCIRTGIGFDLKEDVARTLTLKDQCGEKISCKKTVLVKWSVGDPEVKTFEYTKDSLN